MPALLILVAVLTFVAGVLWLRRDPRPGADEIPRWDAETLARLSDGGWSETFARPVDRPTPISTYDPRWKTLFGSLQVLPHHQVAAGSESMDDGGDDYAFFTGHGPLGDVEITLDGWWGGEWRSLGVQGVVQPDPPHRLYEAALWEGAFSLFYFHGPESGDYETLARTEVGDLPAGFYRIVLRTRHDGDTWSLSAELMALDEGGRLTARVEAQDNRLSSIGYQGMGVLSGERTMVTGIAVRPLEPR